MAKTKRKPRKPRPGRITRRPESKLGEESERLFQRVAEEAVHGDRGLLDGLTPHERQVVFQWLSEAIIDGTVENVVHDTLWEMDYVRKPVDIETFVKDDYYFGKVCSELHPYWIRDLVEVFGAGKQVSEWIMTGAIGTGKTTVAMTALGYKLHCISCLRNPAAYYGLLPESLIIFGIYSITKKQVADTGYFKLRGWVDTSPYFRNDFPRSMKIDSKIDFKPGGQNLQVIPGCVAEGTLIATPDGDVPIETLVRTSPHVLTNESGQPSVANYAGIADAGMKTCVRIELEDGNHLTCSEDHGIHVWEGGYVCEKKAKNIRQGARVLTLSRYSSPRGAALPEVQQDQKGFGVRNKGGSACGWSAESIQRALQAVRIQGGVPLLSGQQNREASIRQAAALVTGMERGRARPLEEVLRSKQRTSQSAWAKRVIDARTNRSQEVTASAVVFKESQVCIRARQGVCKEAPGEDQGTSTTVCKDTERSCAPKSCGSAEGSTEACLTGRLVTFRYEDRLGILHTEVCLLWSSTLSGELDVGPHSPAVSWWSDGMQEHGSSLHRMQQQEAYYERVGLHFDAASRASKPGLKPDTRVVLLRVKDVRQEGRRHCFDLIHVEKSHTYFAGSILTKNSMELHALGLDLFSFSMDEVNFMREKRDKDRGIIAGQAYDLYNATHARIMSRFIRPGGTIPGIMLLMSSRKAQTSFLEERLKKTKNSPHTYVSDYPLWVVKPKAKYILPKFSVEVGDRVAQSRILEGKEKARPSSRTVDGIPGEFKPAFVEDIDEALRDIAGVATFNVSPLIRDRESIFDAIRPSLVHPFKRTEAMIDYKDDVMLDEFFIVSTACRIEESKWRPRLNPTSARFMHVDLSLSGDCAGIAMGHVSGLVRREKMMPDGTTSVVEHPFIIIDFMLRINPPPASEIDLSKIRAFVYYISKLYPLAMITFDGFQSADSKQLLQKAGFDARILSIDKNDKPYLALRSAHFERRIAMYNYEPYTGEVLDLQRDVQKQKVDHPTRSTRGGKGSKDVSDAMAGVVYVCLNDARAVAGASVIEDTSEVEDYIRRQIVDPQSEVPIRDQAQRSQKKVGGTRLDMAALDMD